MVLFSPPWLRTHFHSFLALSRYRQAQFHWVRLSLMQTRSSHVDWATLTTTGSTLSLDCSLPKNASIADEARGRVTNCSNLSVCFPFSSRYDFFSIYPDSLYGFAFPLHICWLILPLGDSFHREHLGVTRARKYHLQPSSNGQLEGTAYVISTNSVVRSVPLSPFHLLNLPYSFQEHVCGRIQENAPALLASSGSSGAKLIKKHKRYANSTVLMLVFIRWCSRRTKKCVRSRKQRPPVTTQSPAPVKAGQWALRQMFPGTPNSSCRSSFIDLY